MADKLFKVAITGDLQTFIDEKIAGLASGTFERDLLDEVQSIFLNRIRTRYLATLSPFGDKWVESQAARDRKLSGKDGLTGFDTGNLFHSIQADAPVEDEARVISTDVPYAGYFNSGTKKMPARPFMDLNTDDVTVAQALTLKRVKSFFGSNLS